MRSRLIVCLSLLVAIIFSQGTFEAKADPYTTPSAILANPGKYDGQHLIVAGTVERIQATVSVRGDYIDTFDLCDRRCVRVLLFGDPTIYEGELLAVHGKYTEVKQASGITFNNEIRADAGSASISTAAPGAGPTNVQQLVTLTVTAVRGCRKLEIQWFMIYGDYAVGGLECGEGGGAIAAVKWDGRWNRLTSGGGALDVEGLERQYDVPEDIAKVLMAPCPAGHSHPLIGEHVAAGATVCTP
ncbi:MAG TPA: hypothetical protein VKF82_06395 [Candidatus Eremiobacteraceae bacterium]|nr:hypothetical protein [Candidatus Eremiobacteraceae bacterium]